MLREGFKEFEGAEFGGEIKGIRWLVTDEGEERLKVEARKRSFKMYQISSVLGGLLLTEKFLLEFNRFGGNRD